jgi:hypothetical protein
MIKQDECQKVELTFFTIETRNNGGRKAMRQLTLGKHFPGRKTGKKVGRTGDI